MTIIIIDDEPHAIRAIQRTLFKIPGLEEKGSFSSVACALDFLEKEGEVNLIFCDVEMEEMDGLTAAPLLKEKCNRLVMITAHGKKYQDRGFEVHVDGYLKKPVREARVLDEMKQCQWLLDRYVPKMPKAPIILPLKIGKELKMVDLENLVMAKRAKNYLLVYLNDGEEPLVVSLAMATLVKEIHAVEGCFQVNRGCVVNVRYIQQVTKEGGLILYHGHYVAVEKNRKQPLVNYCKTLNLKAIE